MPFILPSDILTDLPIHLFIDPFIHLYTYINICIYIYISVLLYISESKKCVFSTSPRLTEKYWIKPTWVDTFKPIWPSPLEERHPNLVGGWTNPFERYSSNWIIPPGKGEKKKRTKPPPLDLQKIDVFCKKSQQIFPNGGFGWCLMAMNPMGFVSPKKITPKKHGNFEDGFEKTKNRG